MLRAGRKEERKRLSNGSEQHSDPSQFRDLHAEEASRDPFNRVKTRLRKQQGSNNDGHAKTK